MGVFLPGAAMLELPRIGSSGEFHSLDSWIGDVVYCGLFVFVQ